MLPNPWLPIGWLTLFLLLVICGHYFRAVNPILEGDILALLAAGVLAFNHLIPLIAQRIVATGFGRHSAETIIFALAALAFWTRAELLPRWLPKLPNLPGWDPAAWEAIMFPVESCIGTATAAAAIWIALPSQWIAVGWLVLVLALGLSADLIASAILALQADALAVASLIGLSAWNLEYTDWSHRTPLLIALALLYCGMRRKTTPGSRNYAPAAYSWAAAGLLPFITFNLFIHNDAWIAPVLTGLCLTLFEIGLFSPQRFSTLARLHTYRNCLHHLPRQRPSLRRLRTHRSTSCPQFHLRRLLSPRGPHPPRRRLLAPRANPHPRQHNHCRAHRRTPRQLHRSHLLRSLDWHSFSVLHRQWGSMDRCSLGRLGNNPARHGLADSSPNLPRPGNRSCSSRRPSRAPFRPHRRKCNYLLARPSLPSLHCRDHPARSSTVRFPTPRLRIPRKLSIDHSRTLRQLSSASRAVVLLCAIRE